MQGEYQRGVTKMIRRLWSKIQGNPSASEAAGERNLLEGNPSPARRAFYENAERLYRLLSFFGTHPQVLLGELAQIENETERIDKRLAQPAELGQGDLKELEESYRRAKARSEKLVQIQADFQLNMGFFLEWHCVMLVTFAETYLQDALAYYAGQDRELMKDSDQKVNYNQVISAGSIEEIATELRYRWAKNFIEGGGPTRWFQKLKSMGASSLQDSWLKPMEDLWGIRHLLVHRAGKVDSDFRKHHPDLAAKEWVHIEIDPSMVVTYTETIRDFVMEVDMFLERRSSAPKGKRVKS